MLDGVSWGANKLSSIGTTDGGDTVRTMTKWDWNDCGESHSYSSSLRERGGRSKVGETDYASLCSNGELIIEVISR